MNLVAKEFVAAQDPDDPGVLVLSKFAGAAEELDSAILVNPHETEAMAEAIKTALEMTLAERRERYNRMFNHLAANDIARWAEHFLAALAESRRQSGIFEGFAALNLRAGLAAPLGELRSHGHAPSIGSFAVSRNEVGLLATPPAPRD